MMSLTAPAMGSKSYSERVSASSRATDPISLAGDGKQLDVLYIQAMDSDHSASKEHARKALKGSKINYGEISVNKLEGKTEAEKMASFRRVLTELRETGRLHPDTQVILSFQPGEQAGELRIGDKTSGDNWKLESVIQEVRGHSRGSHSLGQTKFKGTIHVFAHEPEDFDKDKLKRCGNLLMHATGKFNWDHQQDHAVARIIASAREIKGSDQEQRAQAMRNALTNHAGYPIFRVSSSHIKIKYPTFVDKARTRYYQQAVKAHKNPVDMLIYSLENEPAETVRKRLISGGLLRRIRDVTENRGMDRREKSLLLTAVVASSKDQDAKLKLLSEMGVKFSKYDRLLTGGVKAAIEKNRDVITVNMLEFLENIDIKTVSKNSIVDFLKKKIASNMPEIGRVIGKIGHRLEEIPVQDVDELVIAAIHSKTPELILQKLLDAGLKMKKIEPLALQQIADEVLDLKSDVKFKILDFFEKNNIRLADHMDKRDRLEYRVFSKIPGYREKVQGDLSALIEDDENPILLRNLVHAAIDLVRRENDLSLIQFLLDSGLDPDYQLNAPSTLLQQIFLSGLINADLISLLVSEGADAGVLDEDGGSLLHLLASNRQVDRDVAREVANMLIDLGNQTDLLAKDGISPMYAAAFSHNRGVLDALLPREFDKINLSSGPGGQTLLHAAMVRPLSYPANIDPVAFDQTLDLLLTWGAGSDQMDDQELTPQDYIVNIRGYKNYNLEERRRHIADSGVKVLVV